MQCVKRTPLAILGTTAALLFSIAFVAGADQMRALPGTAPTAAAKPVVVAPAGLTPLPDLAFSYVSVENTTYPAGAAPQSLVVNNVIPSASSGVNKAPNPCGRSFTFPLQLIVKNIGQADFVPKGSAQAVSVTIGQWGGAKDLVKLPVTASQTMNFNVTLPTGKYLLNADIDLHNGVAEARADNNKLSWPLEVKCEVKAGAVMAPAFPAGTPSASIPTPKTLLPEIIADGGGMQIGGQFTAFANAIPVSVRSAQMMPTASSPTACRFSGKFQLKNTGGGAASMFDVYTMADSQQGVRSMNTGYSIPGMAPGEIYSQSFLLDLAPDTYSVILVIDPNHKLKQATQDVKKYLVKIKANCGSAGFGGGVQKMMTPAAPK